ncbi:hypothetical protein ABIC07_008928 [Bradyrhizobium sp. RT9a]
MAGAKSPAWMSARLRIAFLRGIAKRGLRKLVNSDAHEGIKAAAKVLNAT